MATSSSQSQALHRQWRDGVKTSPRRIRTGSYWRRFALLTLALLLLAGLAYLLFVPYWQPQAHMIVLRARGLQALEGPIAPVAGSELGLLAPLQDAAVCHSSPELDRLLSSPDAVGQLSEKIRKLELRPKDVLIVYVAAHGILDEQGAASLVCDNYDPDALQDGVCRLRFLLDELDSCEANTKLVILDAGQMDYDPSLGTVGTEFPSAVQQELDSKEDASLCVFCSHGDRQKSHRSTALGGSVFGSLTFKGLHGAADADGDLVVTIGELASFVEKHVGAWVEQVSAGAAVQTPELMHHASFSEQVHFKELFSVDHVPIELRTLNVDSLIREANDGHLGTRQPVSAGVSTRGLLNRTAREADSGDLATLSENDPKPSHSTGSDENSAASGQASSEKTPEGDSSVVAANGRLANLIDKAWRIRDAIAERSIDDSPGLSRPVDATPHLWREFHDELIAYQQLMGSGVPDNAKLLADVLTSSLARFVQSDGEKTILQRDFLKLSSRGKPTSRSARGASSPSIPAVQLNSLAMVKKLAQSGVTENPHELLAADEQLERLIDATEEEFTTTLDEFTWTDIWNHYYELRLVRRLAGETLIDPNLKQLAIKVRRHGEQAVANSLGCASWLELIVAEGDRWRLAGERDLFDRVAESWQDLARDKFNRASEIYQEAERTCNDLKRAMELRNQLVFLAPYYVQAHQSSGGIPDGLAPSYESLRVFLDQLAEFDNLLAQPRADRIGQLLSLSNRLSAQYENDRESLVASTHSLRSGSPKLGDGWKTRRLLETPFLTARARQSMSRGLANHEIALAQSLDLDVNPITDSDSATLYRQWELEVKLARLATWTAEGAFPDRSFENLAEKHLSLTNTISAQQASEELAESALNQDVALKNMSSALKSFYKQLPLCVEDALSDQREISYSESSAKQIRALRALRLLRGGEAWRFRNVSSFDLSLGRELFAMLSWQHQRVSAAQLDVPDAQRDYLSAVSDRYRSEASRLYRTGGTFVATPPQVEIRLPQAAALEIDRHSQEVEFTVAPHASESTSVWIILQYDPQQLEVVTEESIYHEHRLPHEIAGALQNASASSSSLSPTQLDLLSTRAPYRPDLASLLPTLQAAESGTLYPMRFKIRALPGRAESAQLIVKAIGRTNASMQENAASETIDRATIRSSEVTYVRQYLKFPLRVLELAIDGLPNSWTSSARQVNLYPFPNRMDRYRFGVLNRGSRSRGNVALRVFAPSQSVDLADTTPEQVDALLAESRLLQSYTMEVPADGASHFPGEADFVATAPPTEESAEASTTADPSEEPAEPPQGPLLRHGLLVEIQDPEEPQQRIVRQIKILPQRPRRYVEPSVSYNPTLERIEVRADARLRSLLPSTPVRLECEIADEQLGATGGKLRDQLGPPDYQAKMFVNVPATPPRTVTLYLHVDDYPRAFIYRVPCGAHTTDLGEESTLTHVRMRKLPPGSQFQPPQTVTPVGLEIDAPIGTFERGGDAVRVAIDENMDHLLGPELGVMFSSDRQVRCHLEGLDEAGVLSLHTQISDHVVNLPTDRLQNVSVRVHARMALETGRFDAQPATLNIDGGPPKIHYVQVFPFGGLVESGTPLTVWTLASDALSGVESVELVIADQSVDEFAPNAAPVPAMLDPQSNPDDPYANLYDPAGNTLQPVAGRVDSRPKRWIAQLPTDGLTGVQSLLVRATDRVGNVSDTYLARLQLISPEEAAAQAAAFVANIDGVITYRKERIEGVEVTLVSPEGEVVATTGTSANGEYSFRSLPAGEYQVLARGIIYNVPRCGAATASVDPAGPAVVLADFSLDQKCE